MAEVISISLMLLAIFLYLFHDALMNPHGDDELIIYAKQFLLSVQNGYFGDFYLTARKYPFVSYPIIVGTYVVNFFGFMTLKKAGVLAPPTDPYFYDWLFNLSARMYPVACSVGIALLLGLLTRKQSGWRSLVLLSSSVFFVVLGTSVRPHVIMTFWTLLAFCCAIQWLKHNKIHWIIGSFLAATMAFCSLQNGLLAFLFPTIALLGRRDFRRQLPLWLLLIGFSGSLSLIIGYPLILSKFLFHNNIPLGLDLGHNYPMTLNGHGFLSLWHYATNDIILLLFSCLGIAMVWRQKLWSSPVFLMSGIYLAVFCLLFGLHNQTAPRYYIAIIPYLILVSQPVLPSLKTKPYLLLIAFSLILQAKLVYLASQPNSYQVMRTVLHDTDGGYITATLPYVTFDADNNRLTDNEDMAVFKVSNGANGGENWALCVEVLSNNYFSRGTPLWDDEPNGLAEILTGRRSGLNLYLFCKKSLLEQPVTPVTL